MYKRIIEYVDFDDNQRKEEFCFHLTEAEVIKMLVTTGDYTLDKVLERIAKERNGKKIIEMFEMFVKTSYGEKSLDGRRFVKNDEVLANFVETEAYSKLLMEITTDAKKAVEFIKGIIPADLAKAVEKTLSENPDGIPDEVKDYLPKDLLGGPVKESEETILPATPAYNSSRVVELIGNT